MDIQVGQVLHWHKIVSNYGHISVRRVTVKRIGKRITVEVPLKDGGHRLTSVRVENLREIESGE